MVLGIITQVGRSVLPDMLVDSDKAEVAYVAWGLGTTEAADRDFQMETEVARMAATVSRLGAYTLYLTANFTITEAQDGYDFTEVGVFDASVGGRMIYHGHQMGGGAQTELVARPVAEDDILAFQLQFLVDAGSWS